MKKVAASITLVLLFLQGSAVSAETAATTSARSVPERLVTIKVQTQQQTGQKLQAVKQRLDERKKSIIKRFYEQMLKRFEAALNRESRMADRISSRLDKAEANGKDVASLRTKLASVRTTIDEAKAKKEEIRTKFEGLLTSVNPKDALQDIRKSVQDDLKGKVKQIHQMLVDIVKSIKGLGGGTEEATSTSAL